MGEVELLYYDTVDTICKDLGCSLPWENLKFYCTNIILEHYLCDHKKLITGKTALSPNITNNVAYAAFRRCYC